jgi:hypothetical protein
MHIKSIYSLMVQLKTRHFLVAPQKTMHFYVNDSLEGSAVLMLA